MYFILVHVFLNAWCNLTEQVYHLESIDRQKGTRKPLTTETGVHAQVCPASYNTSFAHTVGYTEHSYTVSNFHGIMNALLNHTTSGKIGMDVVT